MDPIFALSLLTDPNKQNCLAKTLTPAFLSALRDHTDSKSDTELGEKLGFNSPSAIMSQIKSGRLYLKIISLHNIAAEIGVTYGKLAAIICKKMLVVSDPAKRLSFLAGLQIATQLTDGRYFREKIGGIRKEEQFLKDGIVPSKWIELIPDLQERVRIISTHCGKPPVPKGYNKKNGKPKNGKVFPAGDKSDEKSAAPQPEEILAPASDQNDPPGKTEDVQIVAEGETGFIGPLPEDPSAHEQEETTPTTQLGPLVFLSESVPSEEGPPEQELAEGAPDDQIDGSPEPVGTADPAIVQEDDSEQASAEEKSPVDPDWSQKLDELSLITAESLETPAPQEQAQEKTDLQKKLSDMPCTDDKFFYEITRAIFAAGRASIMQNEEDVFIGRLTKQLNLSGCVVIMNPSDTRKTNADGKIIHFTIMDKEENYFDRKFDIDLLFPSIPPGKPL
jgi:hypothetical protein